MAWLVSPVSGQVRISEIMYHPSSENPAEEYIEILNTGGTNCIMTSWQITGGPQYTFDNPTVLPPGGILVVAANVTNFSAKYPGITNVAGNWVGQLANSHNTIRLLNAAGNPVDSVSYADQGDWAIRQRGPLTVNHRGWVWFAAHDGLDLNTANGQIEGGRSLELINPILLVDSGQNWGASSVSNGTPGLANSIAATNIAPVIANVAHYPPVPRPVDPVTITARLLDEQTNGCNVAVYFRNASSTSPPGFTNLTMFDDGAHGDGVAGDKLFGAVLPVQTNGSVVEFFVRAVDAQANARTWPAAARQLDGTLAQTCNALYQVDDNLAPPAASNSGQPIYRLILTGAEQSEMTQSLMGVDNRSDAEMNGTFVSVDGTGTKIRYNCGIRIRGEGSRTYYPQNWRVNIPTDCLWNELSAINLNTKYIHAQMTGSAFALRSGLPVAAARVVQVRLNGVNHVSSGVPANGSLANATGFGSYVMSEPINNEWAGRRFPADGDGNVYRASIYPYYANLAYEGTNLNSYTNLTDGGYFKTSNKSENDWSDLVNLTWVLSTNTPDSNYVASVTNRLDVGRWARYFAVGNVLDYRETSLFNGLGDDYAMYRGIVDPRFILIGHDFDTILGQGDYTGFNSSASIWLMLTSWHGSVGTNNTAQHANCLFRLLRHPDFAPLYFGELKRLCDTTFAPAEFNLLLEQTLGGWVPESTITAMKTFANARHASVLSQIPQALTVNIPLTSSNGYPRTTSASVMLNGQANAILTRSLLVAGMPATWSAWEGRWTNTVSLHPGINNILVQSRDASGVEFARTNVLVWYDDGSVAVVGGVLASNAAWTAAGGPYNVASNLIVPDGVTLTIEPGATLFIGAGVTMTVNNGGRVLAEGTEFAPIRFTGMPGAAAWGGLTVNGAVGSPESRFAYSHFESNSTVCVDVNGGAILLDHVTFGTRTSGYLSLDGASFLVRDCLFPSAAPGSLFELVHGTLGIRGDGRGIFLRNFFGTANSTSGNYNDVVDFTGGKRPGPVIHFLNNVFIGGGDDLIDLDGTDGWIEGNIFMHAHRNGSPDSASAVSGGTDNFDTSQLTIIGNLIYDCDHAAMAKQGNFFILYNNTIVHQSHTGGLDTDGAVINLADEGFSEGAGMYLEGNIITDAENLVRGRTNAMVTFTNNIIHQLAGVMWAGPGGSNSTNNPLLPHVPQLSETTNFTTWAAAQVLWDWLKPRAGSPAIASGPNGRDKGGVIPHGASISGEPPGVTPSTSAVLTVGFARTGSGIPSSAFPNGSGFTHYKWRLDGGAWSTETPIATPITLSGLAEGLHAIQVIGRLDTGFYQDAEGFAPANLATTSRVWTVNTALPSLRLNEVLARNIATLVTNGESPDLVELYNFGPGTIDLSGMGLSDNATNKYKYTFPAGTTLGAGQFLVLYSDSNANPVRNLGFGFKSEGGGLFLFAPAVNGGAQLDAVSFGPQLVDYSVGRLADGSWGLCKPTFGAANVAQPATDGAELMINEWAASGAPTSPDDFIELFNPDPVPAAMGGLWLSDEPVGLPAMHQIAPLSFIPPSGWFAFKADGKTDSGAGHLGFQLAPEQGRIGLFTSNLTLIDQVAYGPQTTGVSQGRTPDGGTALAFFSTPTPGSGNPGALPPFVTSTTFSLMAYTNNWRYNQSNNLDGVSWTATNYNDSAWQTGRGLLAFESLASIVPLVNTTLLAPNSPPPGLGSGHAYYFRAELVLTNDLSAYTINGRMRLDDCAAIYINGTEITRTRLPAGTITNLTFGGGAIGTGTDADMDELLSFPGSAFRLGTNVIAVEVHQSRFDSSDIVWGLALDATRFITNFNAVMLNEILADNASCTNADGTLTDWVELYNPAAAPFSLAGFSLSDDPATPGRWIFPAGVVVPPGGFLVVHFDPATSASNSNGPVLNTGFGLNSAGDEACLFTPGNTLLDSVAFGPQAADFAIGRVPEGLGGWSLTMPTPGSANIAATLGNNSGVRINEWAATVTGGADWFELYNPAPQPVALGGLYLTDALASRTKHLIAPLTFLGVNTNGWCKFVADGSTAQGANHVNFSLAGGGEAIGLFPAGTAPAIDSVTFGTQSADVSEGRFPDGSPVRVFFTRPSPGAANWLYLTNVVINEVLSHTDLPLEDAIELRNLTASPVDVSGWFISDEVNDLRKFRIPNGTVIPASGFKVFYEKDFNAEPGFAGSFSFNSYKGDDAWLTAADGLAVPTGYRDYAKFGPSFNGVSFGRYTTSVGVDYPASGALTFGTAVTAQSPTNQISVFRTGAGLANAYPRVGPVVISEIMYHPQVVGTNDNTQDEFIELRNISGGAVPLYDTLHSTNGWKLRDAVDYVFNTNHSIPAGGFLVVVGFDPGTNASAVASFRSKFGTNAIIVGPWSGKLDNGSESVELVAPDNPQTTPPDVGYVPYVIIDKVVYTDVAPWPTNADGYGFSLQRINAANYGNDPVNWTAGSPSAGASGLADTDGDGMPDGWEDANGLNKLVNDAALDPDADGFTNFQEYTAGTNPKSAESRLKIDSVSTLAGDVQIRFLAVSNRTYSVLYSTALNTGDWSKLADVAVQPATQTMSVTDNSKSSTARFYRLVTPAMP